MDKAHLDQNNCLVFETGILSDHTLHPIWLRERISGDKYIDVNNLQRLYEPSLLENTIKIEKFNISKDFFEVTFNDGKSGIYFIKELFDEINEFDPIPKKQSWKNNLKELPFHDYSIIANSKDNLIKMLSDFQKLGFVILKNISKEKGTVIKFAQSLGPVRSTNFGEHFDVYSKPNPNDLAYTGLALSAHTDNPYRKPIPGIQLLHCISNEAKGGDSTLVDGMAVEEYLKKHHKPFHEILSSTKIHFRFTDKDIILENWGKLIELDEKGKFIKIRFSGRLDYVPLLEFQKLSLFYEARKKLFELYASKEFEINFRLSAGMLLMFDNHRLLHGRSAYDQNTGFRHLQGCYIEHDSTEGKLRRLLKKH